MNEPKIIAEIGCNHKGDINIAKELISVAAIYCKVDAVKLQKRNPIELLSKEEYNHPHPNPINSYGDTYGLHREFLEFNLEQHKELKEYAESFGLHYSASVWDITSAKEIISLKPNFIKIPSALNLNFELLKLICDDYKGDIHISLGMTKKDEVLKIMNFIKECNRMEDLILYHCTAGYPVPFESVFLLDIKNLVKNYGDKIKAIGFSGHHLGIAADIAAMAYGATWFERHYTLDRTWKGTDHAASLEPQGMRKLARDLRNVYKTFKYKPDELSEIEMEQRIKLKKIKLT
jgi:N-acetylneuraminate synthase